jgi:hypothetical protein
LQGEEQGGAKRISKFYISRQLPTVFCVLGWGYRRSVPIKH